MAMAAASSRGDRDESLFTRFKESFTPSQSWSIDDRPLTHFRLPQHAATQQLYRDCVRSQAGYPFDVVDKETGQALPWPHAIKKPALEPMRFRKLKISAAAVSKMLQHAEVGISEGVATVGKPVEIMGVLVGYCDYANDEIVVVDSRRVPCAGGAHSAEPDPDTAVAMANISHELEQLYDNVVIIGWYHSHPFDEVKDSPQHHCRFSAIDVETQALLQRQYDYFEGIPFVGVVVDPLTSIARRKFHIGAYRTYTPRGVSWANPLQHLTPDGRVVPDEHKRTERWLSQWSRYYELEVTFVSTGETLRLLKELQWFEPLLKGPGRNTSSSTEDASAGLLSKQIEDAFNVFSTARAVAVEAGVKQALLTIDHANMGMELFSGQCSGSKGMPTADDSPSVNTT